MPSTKWYHDFLKWLVLFGYFGKIPPILNHHLSDEVPNQDHIILHLATLFSLDVFYFVVPWCPNSWVSNTTSQANCRDIIAPTQKPQKQKKQVNEIFLQIHTPVVSNICRVQWFGLRTPSAIQSTPHKQGILQVHVSEMDGLSLEFTWLSAQPFAGNVSLDQLQLVDLWEQRNPSISVNGRTSPKQCHTVGNITKIQHGSPKSQPHVSSKKSGPNKKDIWRKQTFLQRTWEPHLVFKKMIFERLISSQKQPLYPLTNHEEHRGTASASTAAKRLMMEP